MTKKERFYAAIERKPTDRPAGWLGMPTEAALPGLYEYFGVTDYYGLKRAVDDDIWSVEIPFTPFDFTKPSAKTQERTLTNPGFFEDHEDESAVDLFPWPDPAECIDLQKCEELLNSAPEGYPVMAVIWSSHFQEACAAFGMQDALIKMKIAPELFEAVIDRITEFYLAVNKILYETARGRLDAVLIGNDFGTQQGLIISREDLKQFVFKGTARLVEQAKSYGLKVFHHSCGAISQVIPDITRCGADVVHPIQALAAGMEPEALKEQFLDTVSFCGGVDAQYLLVNGTPEQIEEKVKQLYALFPTGLIISPSHEAILPDIPPSNIDALFQSIRKLEREL